MTVGRLFGPLLTGEGNKMSLFPVKTEEGFFRRFSYLSLFYSKFFFSNNKNGSAYLRHKAWLFEYPARVWSPFTSQWRDFKWELKKLSPLKRIYRQDNYNYFVYIIQ